MKAHGRMWTVLATVAIATLVLFVAGCGSGDEGSTGAKEESPAAGGSGDQYVIGMDCGFTGPMAMDIALAEMGVDLALKQIDDEWMGKPVKCIKADTASDPVIAVDKARQLVESNGAHVIVGPMMSPATAAVTAYLAKAGGIPDISLLPQPTVNLKTANGLAVIPSGLDPAQGYYLGKYVVEELGYKRINCLSYEDTAGRELQAGFNKAIEDGGGEILMEEYVPSDVVDFSPYITTMDKNADATCFWVYGNGAAPFVKQYNDYGLTAPLLSTMANNFSDAQLKDLGDLGVGMVAVDIYAAEVDSPANATFVADFQAMYDGQYPTPQAYGGWLAVNIFLKAVEETGGDTTPAALIDAMSDMEVDGPGGKLTMMPYEDAFISKGSYFILETKDVGDRVTWVPVKEITDVERGPLPND